MLAPTIRTGLAVCLLSAASTSAFGDIKVVFDEGAPKDRFTFTNTSDCSLKSAQLTLDLSASQSGLVFDPTPGGAGVEVFQPLQVVSGAAALKTIPTVGDGDNQVALDIVELASGESIAFTVDVDDTMGGREITVSGSEIEGSRVLLSDGEKTTSGIIGSNAEASVPVKRCS